MDRIGIRDPEAILVYIPVRGHAELIRILLAVTRTSFQEVKITDKDQLDRLKKDGSLLFGQLPLLKTDGLNLVQTGAISRYLARKGNLLGTHREEAAKIEMLYEGTRDFYSPFMKQGMPGQNHEQWMDEIKTEVMAKYLPIFNSVLESNREGPYLVGKRLSLADVGLMEPLFAILDFFDTNVLEHYFGIKCFLKVVRSDNTVQYYIKDIRMPPIGRPPLDEKSISQLMSIVS